MEKLRFEWFIWCVCVWEKFVHLIFSLQNFAITIGPIQNTSIFETSSFKRLKIPLNALTHARISILFELVQFDGSFG